MNSLELIQSVINCRECKFRDTLRYGDLPLLGNGSSKAGLMFINLRATIEAHLTEKSLDTRNEALFNKILEEAKVSKRDIYVTNLVKCAGPTTPVKDFAKNANTCYTTHLIEEIRLIKPKAIVCFGATVPKVMFGDKNAKAGSSYILPTGERVSVTHSMEELYRHGKGYMEECVQTIIGASKCLSQ